MYKNAYVFFIYIDKNHHESLRKKDFSRGASYSHYKARVLRYELDADGDSHIRLGFSAPHLQLTKEKRPINLYDFNELSLPVSCEHQISPVGSDTSSDKERTERDIAVYWCYEEDFDKARINIENFLFLQHRTMHAMYIKDFDVKEMLSFSEERRDSFKKELEVHFH